MEWEADYEEEIVRLLTDFDLKEVPALRFLTSLQVLRAVLMDQEFRMSFSL